MPSVGYSGWFAMGLFLFQMPRGAYWSAWLQEWVEILGEFRNDWDMVSLEQRLEIISKMLICGLKIHSRRIGTNSYSYIYFIALISSFLVPPSPWGPEEWAIAMETQSQASSAAEKKKRVETIVATKGASARTDISEKAVASSTTSNGTSCLFIVK